MATNKDAPRWKHDCERCRFLGQTIGGGRLVDCYVCLSSTEPDADYMITIIARFGDNGPDYYSMPAGYAHAHGHSELFAAEAMWKQASDEGARKANMEVTP